jgi:hypothetical protein
MVQTRSGQVVAAREGQDNTDTTQQDNDIPAEVQVSTQVQQEDAQTPMVYTAGTYAATYQRPPTIQRTPSVPDNFRPAQCEHTRILRALVEYPQGNLEEIQEKTLRST